MGWLPGAICLLWESCQRLCLPLCSDRGWNVPPETTKSILSDLARQRDMKLQLPFELWPCSLHPDGVCSVQSLVWSTLQSRMRCQHGLGNDILCNKIVGPVMYLTAPVKLITTHPVATQTTSTFISANTNTNKPTSPNCQCASNQASRVICCTKSGQESSCHQSFPRYARESRWVHCKWCRAAWVHWVDIIYMSEMGWQWLCIIRECTSSTQAPPEQPQALWRPSYISYPGVV